MIVGLGLASYLTAFWGEKDLAHEANDSLGTHTWRSFLSFTHTHFFSLYVATQHFREFGNCPFQKRYQAMQFNFIMLYKSWG
jgi:hypothetical protein